jgi:flagellin-like hook-associated protein FlgL
MKIWNGRFFLLSLLILALAGCGTLSTAKYQPEVPIASPPLPPTPPPQDGSLWTGRQSNGLVADSRPTNVGGPVTLGDGVEVTLGGTWNAGDRFSIPVYKPIEYRGDTHSFEIAIGAQNRLVINEVGSAAVGGDQGANDLFQILAQLKSNLEANDPAEVGSSLEKLRSYQTHITSIMAGLGASLDRVSMKENVYGSLKNELTRQISDKGDTDLVEAVNLLQTKENAYQAALLSSSKVMGMSLMDYL